MTIRDHAGSCTHVHVQERAGRRALPRPLQSESLSPERLDVLPEPGHSTDPVELMPAKSQTSQLILVQVSSAPHLHCGRSSSWSAFKRLLSNNQWSLGLSAG